MHVQREGIAVLLQKSVVVEGEKTYRLNERKLDVFPVLGETQVKQEHDDNDFLQLIFHFY